MQTFKQILFLLDTDEKKKAFLLLIMILISASLGMLGVASIFPFVAIIANPDIVQTNLILNNLFQISNIFGVQSTEKFIFALGILLFFIFITFIVIITFFIIIFIVFYLCFYYFLISPLLLQQLQLICSLNLF